MFHLIRRINSNCLHYIILYYIILYYIILYYIIYLVQHIVLKLIPTVQVPILFLTSPFFFRIKKTWFLLRLIFCINESLICAQGAPLRPLPSALYYPLKHVTARDDIASTVRTACGICRCSMRSAHQALTHTAVLPSGAAILYRIVAAQSYL